MTTRLLREELRRAAPGRPSAFTIGTFDGVHRGHQFLIRLLEQRASARGLACGVITLYPHPLTVVRPGTQVPYLTGLDERIELLQALGVDGVGSVTFTPELSQTSAEEFVSAMVEELQLKFLLVGPDFALGRGREGSGERLVEIGARLGVEVEFAPLESEDGHKIGSRDIRDALAAGDIERVNFLLGRRFSLRGPVVHGGEVGRLLGFPTANVAVSRDRALPGFGVYAGCAYLEVSLPSALDRSFEVSPPSELGCSNRAVSAWNGSGGLDARRDPSHGVPGEAVYKAAINVGIRPTINTGAPMVEAYLIDFSGDIYGRRLRLDFCRRLRGEEKFDGVEALKAQIARDVAEAATTDCSTGI